MKNKTKRNYLLTLGLMALLFTTYSCKKEEVIVIEEEKVEKTEAKPSNCTYCCTPHDITGTWYWLSSRVMMTGDDYTSYDTSITVFSEVDSRFEFSEETVKKFNGSDLVYESKYYITCEEAFDGDLANILRIEAEDIEYTLGFNEDFLMFVDNTDSPYIHTHYAPDWTP